MKKLSFIIAEKSYVIRTGILKIISSFPDVSILKEFEDINSIIKFVNKNNPDFLIINLKFIEDAHYNIRKMFSNNIQTKFILLTGTKRSNEHFLYFDEQISVDDDKTTIINKLQTIISANKPSDSTYVNTELSGREKDVVKQVALGKTNKEIAEELFISVHTVITHRKNITNKLDIKTVSGLTVYAILNNIIDIDEAS